MIGAKTAPLTRGLVETSFCRDLALELERDSNFQLDESLEPIMRQDVSPLSLSRRHGATGLVMSATLCVVFAACLVAFLPAKARAEQQIRIEISNESDMKRSIELRDMLCEERVVFRAKMEPGESKKVRICADDQGIGAVAAVVATGCASATVNMHQGLKNGDVLAP